MPRSDNYKPRLLDTAESSVNEDKLRLILDNVDCGIMIVDPLSCRIIDANKKALGLMGVDLDEAVGCSCQRFLCRSFHGECPVVCMDYSIEDAEDALLSVDGQIRSVKRTAVPITLDGRQCLLETFIDVTRARQNELALSLFSAAIQSTSEGILVINTEGRVESFNDTFENMWDIPPSIVHSGDRNAAMAYVLDKVEYPQTFIEKFEQVKADPHSEDRTTIKLRDGRIFEWQVYPQNVDGQSVGCVFTIRDVTENETSKTNLRRAKEAAEAADRAKSKFIAGMAREMQNPLLGIIGTTELMLETKLTLEQHSYMEAIKSSSDSLLWSVNDILDFTKIEDSKMELEHVVFDLHDRIDKISLSILNQARKKKLLFTWQISDNVPQWVVGDPVRLEQIYTNLLMNAVKYTENGSINAFVGAESRPDNEVNLVFSVTDTGIGIPEERCQNIFDAFSLSDDSEQKLHNGSGLGLAVSSKLVEMMGGHISVESKEGSGSTFSFNVRLKIACEYPKGNTQPNMGTESTETAIEAVEQNAIACEILVVESSQANRKLVAKILEKSGYRVSVADNGMEALSIVRSKHFDLLLLDMEIAAQTDYSLLSSIRTLESQSKTHIPVIGMVSRVPNEYDEGILQNGLDGYITRPVRAEELVLLIRKILLSGVSQKQVMSSVVCLPDLMKNINSDTELLNSLIELYLEQYQSILQDMYRAYEVGDVGALETIAHRMKSSSGTFAALQAYEAFSALEKICGSGDINSAGSALKIAQDEAVKLADYLYFLKTEDAA